MKNVYLNEIEYYLPELELTNEEINSKFPEWSIDKISSKTGIYSRKIARSDEYASDLACNAAEKLFEKKKIDRNKIQFLILCTQSSDYILPTTACIVQSRLNLPTSIGAIDVNLGCSGYVYCLSLAKAMVSSGQVDNVLILTTDTYSKYIKEDDKSNRSIFGDGASASLVSKESIGFKIGEFVFGTDGNGGENLILKNSRARLYEFNKNTTRKNTDKDLFFDSEDNYLYMNGAEIFKFTSSSVPKLVAETLEKNGGRLEKIDYFVFHQANKFMLEFIRNKIGISPQNFFTFLEGCGNTVSSTIPIALFELSKFDTKVMDGDKKILIAGFGVGYSWAGCVLN